MSIEQIISQFKNTRPLEWIAFATALAQVIFAYYNKAINFLFGFISVTIYIYLFFHIKLYAEATLYFYYAIMSIIGYINWTRESKPVPIRYTSKQDHLLAILICIGCLFLSYFILKKFTDSDVPLWDSIVFATAWAGTFLLMRKKLSNWLWLSASNIIAIPLYVYKNLQATALLTLILLPLGIMGYFKWKNKLEKID